MMPPKILDLQVIQQHGTRDLHFDAHRLVCAGWVGRDHQALQAHIDELFRLGIPKPTHVPIFMNLSTYLLTVDDAITVIGDKSSGEAEYVLLCQGEEIWVTVGSDHTDREVEAQSIPASKQMYAKCLSSRCWPYQEVKGHWGQLILRCWVHRGDERVLYQESPLAAILDPEELLAALPREGFSKGQGVVLFSGTIPTQSGIVYGDSYELEIEDPVLHRRIGHRYAVTILPQHV